MNPGVQAMLVAIVGGVIAQWIGRLIRLPAILPLLLLGVALGPQGPLPMMPLPETAMPGGLRAIIALGVVVILFEGGLSLNINDLRLAPKAVRNLITIGAVVSFVGAVAAAYYLLHMALREALFFGSLMTVTGPTVIGPLLKNIKVKPRIHTVLLWESILIDAVGAMIAVIILQIYFEDFSVLGTGYQFVGGLLVGPVIGLAIGWLVARWLAWRQATGRADEEFDHLLALAGALGVYGLSEKVSRDSGLGAVIAAGLVTAHVLKSQARKLREFKGTLTTLLVSTLFMLLAANFDLKDLKRVWPDGLYVLGVVMLIVRPANILLSTRGSKLAWREKVFLCWIAPRGIVAASVASIIGRTLAEHGAEDAGRQLVAMTFLVIAGTVVLNGLTARPLAWLLNLRGGDAQGMLIVGAHPLGLQLAKFLDHEGVPAILVDTNPKHCAAAKLLGFHTIECSALDHVQLAIQDLTGIGQLIAMTANAGINARTCQRTAPNLGLRPYHAALRDMSPTDHLRMFQLAKSSEAFSDLDLAAVNSIIEAGKTKVICIKFGATEASIPAGALLPLLAIGTDSIRPYCETDHRADDREIVCLEFDLPAESLLPFKPFTIPTKDPVPVPVLDSLLEKDG